MMTNEVLRNMWIEGALAVVFIWTATCYSERIRQIAIFRIASLLLALSISSPMLYQIAVLFFRDPGSRSPFPNAYLYVYAIPSTLTALSFLLGLFSMLPPQKRDTV